MDDDKRALIRGLTQRSLAIKAEQRRLSEEIDALTSAVMPSVKDKYTLALVARFERTRGRLQEWTGQFDVAPLMIDWSVFVLGAIFEGLSHKKDGRQKSG